MTITWQHAVGFLIGIFVMRFIWARWVAPWLLDREFGTGGGPVSIDPDLRALGLPARGPNEEWDGRGSGHGSCLECTELCSMCRPADDPLAAGRPKEAEGWDWCRWGAREECPFGKQERYAALQEAGPSC